MPTLQDKLVHCERCGASRWATEESQNDNLLGYCCLCEPWASERLGNCCLALEEAFRCAVHGCKEVICRKCRENQALRVPLDEGEAFCPAHEREAIQERAE